VFAYVNTGSLKVNFSRGQSGSSLHWWC